MACQVSVETAPDPGHAAASRDRRAARIPTRPRLARETLSEIVRVYPAGAADLKARVALTFNMVAGRPAARAPPRSRATSRPAWAGITQRLHATGAGVAMPVDAQRLCEIVHAAYNPRAAELLEEARAAGEPAAAALGGRRPGGRGRPRGELLARRRRVGDVGDDAGAAR